jgi:hypothetical protein
LFLLEKQHKNGKIPTPFLLLTTRAIPTRPKKTVASVGNVHL